MGIELRRDNLEKSWQFVKNANLIYHRSLPRYVLLKVIREKLGVTEDTAIDYIRTLKEAGIEIRKKKLSLKTIKGLGLDEEYEAMIPNAWKIAIGKTIKANRKDGEGFWQGVLIQLLDDAIILQTLEGKKIIPKEDILDIEMIE